MTYYLINKTYSHNTTGMNLLCFDEIYDVMNITKTPNDHWNEFQLHILGRKYNHFATISDITIGFSNFFRKMKNESNMFKIIIKTNEFSLHYAEKEKFSEDYIELCRQRKNGKDIFSDSFTIYLFMKEEYFVKEILLNRNIPYQYMDRRTLSLYDYREKEMTYGEFSLPFELVTTNLIDILTNKQKKDVLNLLTMEKNIRSDYFKVVGRDNFRNRLIEYFEYDLNTFTEKRNKKSYYRYVPNHYDDPIDLFFNYDEIPIGTFINRGIFLQNSIGLGKTLITIGIICSDPNSKNIVIVPKRILEQWKEQILKNTNLKVKTVTTIPQFNKLTSFEKDTVYLITYTVLENSKKENFNFDVNRIFFDEIHEAPIFNFTNENPIHYLISATPDFLHNAQIYSHLMILSSNLIESPNFEFEYFETKENVKKWLSKVVYRSENIDIELPSFPPPKIVNQIIPYSHSESYIESKISYDSHKIALRSDILKLPNMWTKYISLKKEDECDCEKSLILECGCCICPKNYMSKILDSEYKCPEHNFICKSKYVSKHGSNTYYLLQRVDEILLENPNAKIIISHTENSYLKLIKELLLELGHVGEVLEGSQGNMKNIIKRFNSLQNILLINTDKQSSGLELLICTHIMITNHNNKPENEKQLIGRACRTGQTKEVIIEKFIAKF